MSIAYGAIAELTGKCKWIILGDENGFGLKSALQDRRPSDTGAMVSRSRKSPGGSPRCELLNNRWLSELRCFERHWECLVGGEWKQRASYHSPLTSIFATPFAANSAR